MDVSGGYLYAQDETSFVTSRMRFVGKLPFMLAFCEYSAVRVCGGNGFLYCFSSAALGMILVVLIFNGLFAQLFSFLVDLLAQLPGVDLCRLCDLFFPELFLVGAGLNMGAVNKNRAGVQHSVVQRFVENVLEYLTGQLIRETLAEGVAHRCKVWNLIQQPIAQKPAIGIVHLNLPIGLPQRRNTEQVLKEHHLDQHDRVGSGASVVMAVVRLKSFI